MISITYNSQALYLLDDLPDWARPYKATAWLVTAQESGLTDREARRAHGETLRLRVAYQIKVTGTDARQLAAGLRAHQNEPVCAPLWPAACAWSDRASADITGGLKAVFPAAGGTPRIYATGDAEPYSPTPSANDTLVPLVVGYLESRDLRWLTDTYATFDVALVENSKNAWAITPAAYTAPAGPLPSGYATAPRLFPFLANWDGPRTGYTLRIARDDIGFGRQTSDVARVAAVARTVEQTAWASTADGWSASKLLAFFSDHAAGASFWASGQQSAAVLAADLGASATTATVTDTTGLVIGDRLGLVQKGQLTGWVGPLTGIANPTISFTSSGNAAATAATTSLVPLLLARFDSPKLELEWITDRLATASFRVRELPPELALPAGEALGTTLGNLAPRAWLYLFSKNYYAAGGVLISAAHTSYERDLVVEEADPNYSLYTFNTKRITHGDIKTGLALDRDEITIDCDGLDIAPLLDVALLRLEAPLLLTVLRANVNSGEAQNLSVAWSGEVVSASIKGKRLSAKATALGSAFDRKAPRFYLQPGCNHGLFSTGCGLSASTFAHTATLTAVGTAGYPYTFTIGSLARSGGAVLTAADVFAGGWIQIGSGSTLTRRAILASTAVSGSACVLTLSGDPSPFPSNGTAITIYPGCDNRKETCAGTFNNFLNFGGHPFVPTGNPSLFKLSSDAGSGGKK